MTRPPGFGWSVVATATGFDVFDHFAKRVVKTFASRVDAWTHVTALSAGVAA